MKPTEREIDDVLNKCTDMEMQGETAVPGMTYEQGVKAGIEWVAGFTNDNPLD